MGRSAAVAGLAKVGRWDLLAGAGLLALKGAVVHPAFSFEDTGRIFACHVERAHVRYVTAWWWFTVSSDSHRYAPFHAHADDTQASVRSRVVAYYDTLLSRRSEPRQPWRRSDRPDES